MIYKYEFLCQDHPENLTLSRGCYHIIAAGAAGYSNKYTKDIGIGVGGAGGLTIADLCLESHTFLYVYVGGMARDADYTTPNYNPVVAHGGWNGGGNVASQAAMAPGGGATDIRIGGTSLDDRVLVAGGGGGGSFFSKGGDGGGEIAGDGIFISNSYTGHKYCLGKGGENGKGGVTYQYSNGPYITDQGYTGGFFPTSGGTLGLGGNGTGCGYGGAGGGGGYWGGSGSYNSGAGGGGSSYASSMFMNAKLLIGGNLGDGFLIITKIAAFSNKLRINIHIFHYLFILNSK